MPEPIAWRRHAQVELDEQPQDALVREIREELGIDVAVGELLCRASTRLGDVLVELACRDTTPVAEAPTHSTDHDTLRWVAASALPDLDGAAPNLPMVRMLAHRLG